MKNNRLWTLFTGLTIAFFLVLALSQFAKSAIQGIYGLAVAQTSTRWNNLRDGAAGDNLTSGLLAGQGYYFDGTNFDRIRGLNGATYVVITNTSTLPILILNTSPITTQGTVASTGYSIGWTYLLTNATDTGPGNALDIANIISQMTWVTVVTNTPDSVLISLEAGDDTNNWFMIDNSISNTTAMRHVVNKPVVRLRANLNVLINGVAPQVTVKVMGKQ